jgi:hypothetical protein
MNLEGNPSSLRHEFKTGNAHGEAIVLTYACVCPKKKKKIVWLKRWNESNVLQEAKKFPTFGFFDAYA